MNGVGDLRPFSGIMAGCEMCGMQPPVTTDGAMMAIAVGFKYCDLDCLRVPGNGYDQSVPSLGADAVHHMHRTCQLCGYTWLETVNPSKAPAGTVAP